MELLVPQYLDLPEPGCPPWAPEIPEPTLELLTLLLASPVLPQESVRRL